MKKYIIITHTIYNLGGGQLLTLRKRKILEGLGYEVMVVYKKQRGPFLLEKEYKGIKTLFVPEFEHPLNLVSGENQKKCISKVLLFIGDVTQDSIIESNDVPTAIWGEIVASHLKIRHIYYLIIETSFPSYRYYPYKDFFEYKLKRNELWACNSKGLELSFERDLPNYADSYINVPYDSIETSDTTTPSVNYRDWNYGNKVVITTISRLDKKYIISLYEAVHNICNKYKDKNIELIIVGDTVVGNNKQWLEEQARLLSQTTPNMNLILPGYIKAVGRDLFEHTDLFVGMGTAIITAISEGCLSLSVNPYTSFTSGIFGVETFNFAFNDNGKEVPLEDKIEEVLYKDRSEIKEVVKDYYRRNHSLEAYRDKYNILINKCEEKLQYYDFSKRKRYVFVDRCVSLIKALRMRILFHRE